MWHWRGGIGDHVCGKTHTQWRGIWWLSIGWDGSVLKTVPCTTVQYGPATIASDFCDIGSHGVFLLLSLPQWQVYVLSRMGNSRAALRLIIRNQQDIPRAIEFVRLQRDEELWEELIDWALSSADTTGG
jgi:hypothetical protein